MIYRRLAVVAVAGVAVTAALAGATAMDATSAAQLALWACAAALVAGVSGALVLVAGRGWPIATQISVAALTGMAAVAGGALVAAKRMFISSHDLDVLAVVLAAAGTVAVLVAMALGHRVATASAALGLAAGHIGESDGPMAVGDQATGELAALGRQLEQMSARVEQARRAERAVEASRRDLVAWVSHDLRTPLAGIRALVEALDDGVIDDPAAMARCHRTLLQEANRLALLVDDLFELSSLHAGALQVQLERASLGPPLSSNGSPPEQQS